MWETRHYLLINGNVNGIMKFREDYANNFIEATGIYIQ